MLSENVNFIQQIQEQLSQQSCSPKEPFIKLGSGAAPSLNYNIPQSTAFTMYSPIYVKGIPDDYFQEHCRIAPVKNYFQLVKEKEAAELEGLFAQGIQTQDVNSPLIDGALFRKYLNSNKSDLLKASLKTQKSSDVPSATGEPSTTPPILVDEINEINEVQLASIANQELQPHLVESLGSYKTRMALFPKPIKADPYFMVIEEYTTASFLGDYGAGKTINTFSLLPGEKTTITLKTYVDRNSTKSYSENVIDSFSEASTDDLERKVENETGYSDSSSNSNSTTTTNSKSRGMSGSIGGVIAKVINFGLSGNKQKSSSTTTTNASSQTRASNVKSLNSAFKKHVSSSNSNRQNQVNTTTTESVRETEETSLVRELVNINKSRVLNFIFRELLQQYISITYLSNIKVAFCNGYKDSLQIVDLEDLNKLIEDNIIESERQRVVQQILKNYCSVVNYKDSPIDFIEKSIIDIGRCFGGSEVETFYRLKKGISDSYLVNEQTGFNITVPGPILNVTEVILNTPAVVVDALLGQGEALDCFNSKAQDAFAIGEQLKNVSLVQQMDIIDSITDPIQRIEAYKKVFGDCCDKPQTQIVG